MAASKKVLVLGGRGGIGRAVCRRLLADGYGVEAPSSAQLDLSSPESVDAYFSARATRYWAVVHSAGYNNPKPYSRLCAEDIGRTMAVNALGFFEVLRHALPRMKKGGGRVVAVSSLYGTFARPGRLPYVMSKHALNGLVKTLSLELAQDGVTVNAVSPGFVDTEMTRRNNAPAVIASLRAKIPLGRLARPQDIAGAVAFLLGPDSAYVTGQELVVDGGYSAGGFQK